MLSSLGKMHNCGIIHTDIKPENVMFYPIETGEIENPDKLPVLHFLIMFVHIAEINFQRKKLIV